MAIFCFEELMHVVVPDYVDEQPTRHAQTKRLRPRCLDDANLDVIIVSDNFNRKVTGWADKKARPRCAASWGQSPWVNGILQRQ